MWAEYPTKHKDWQKADSPWEFLAAILEIKAAVDSGDEYSFYSGLPLAIDCSCSGLQVLTLLTRCDVSAPLCNLSESNERGDLYLGVADSIFSEMEYSEEDKKKLDEIIETVESIKSSKALKEYTQSNAKKLSAVSEQFWNRHYAKRRKIVKRSAMTFLYSCGVDEMAKHIYEDHKTDKDLLGINSVFCFCLAFKIYRACQKILPGPVSAMDTLMEVARREHRKDEDFSYKGVYTGFPFVQRYRVDITKRYKVQYLEEKIQLRVKVDEVRIDHESIKELEEDRDKKLLTAKDENHTKNIKKLYKRLIKNKDSEKDACCGASPNFVHKLDAQVLSYTIDDCDFNIKTVHDSVACVGADMDDLYLSYRKAFVDVLGEDILKSMLAKKGYSDLYPGIEYGTLNKTNILNNEHAIS